MQKCFWFDVQMSLIPRCCLLAVSVNEDQLAKLHRSLESCSDLKDKCTWTSSCESWTNYCILSKSHQSLLLRKTPEAFYFVNLKVAKAVRFHETREELFLSAMREMLQMFFSPNINKWLTYCFFSVKRYGDRNNLWSGKNVKKQHLQPFCNLV